MEALSQLALIWAAVYAAVFAAHKTKLTPVPYFLFLGSLMVNVGILPTEHDPVIRGLAELGIMQPTVAIFSPIDPRMS